MDRARPIIGITMDYVDEKPQYMLPYAYCDAIERAGGMPWPIPFQTDLSLVPQIFGLLDGILFTGGDDLDPSLFGQARHPQAQPLYTVRQRFEFELIAQAEQKKMPALGICLGAQLMNVYRGGSLVQFLPDVPRDAPIEHRKLGMDGRRHPVHIEPGTLLHETVGQDDLVANTRHKQAVDRLGHGLRIVATAPDGVVEGIEDPALPLFMAVQWHPENLIDQPPHLALFHKLVKVAGERRG